MYIVPIYRSSLSLHPFMRFGTPLQMLFYIFYVMFRTYLLCNYTYYYDYYVCVIVQTYKVKNFFFGGTRTPMYGSVSVCVKILPFYHFFIRLYNKCGGTSLVPIKPKITNE